MLSTFFSTYLTPVLNIFTTVMSSLKYYFGAAIIWFQAKKQGTLEETLKDQLKTNQGLSKALKLRMDYEQIDNQPKSTDPRTIIDRLSN